MRPRVGKGWGAWSTTERSCLSWSLTESESEGGWRRARAAPPARSRAERQAGCRRPNIMSRMSLAKDAVDGAVVLRQVVLAVEDLVAQQRDPGAARGVEGLLEVDRDRGLAVRRGGDLVDGHDAGILHGVLVVGQVAARDDAVVGGQHVDLRVLGHQPGQEVPRLRLVL